MLWRRTISGAVDAGAIGGALLGEGGRFGSALTVGGYAASGDGLREAMAPLAEAGGMRLISDGRDWMIAGRNAEPDALAIADFRAFAAPVGAGDIAERKRSPLASLPKRIELRHYEPARDYQTGQQSAAIADGGRREQRLDLPAVLSAGAAQALAAELALAASDGRETIRITTDLAALALPVGRIVDLGAVGVWRLTRRMIGDARVDLDCTRHQPLTIAAGVVDGGAAVIAPDWPLDVGELQLFDLPNLTEPAATAPLIVAAVAGSHNGWRGADLWWLADAEAAPLPIGVVRPALALGALGEALSPATTALMDLQSTLIVDLVNPAMELESVSDAVLLAGGNRAMVGSELVQFGLAVPEGAGRWRLSRLLRGRAGTEDRVVLHPPDTPFVLLDDTALLPLPAALTAAVGTEAMVEWAVRGGSDLARVHVPESARALVPLTPVHGTVRPAAGGGLDLGWVRRSRTGQLWRDSVDVPLGESRESYRISLVPPVPGIGPWECSTPILQLTAAEVGGLPASAGLEIRQIGDFAMSPPLIVVLPI